jgi:Uma2 family endonuclease
MPRKSSVAEKLITAQALARMNLDYPCELVAGRIVRMSPARGPRHGFVAARIHRLLDRFVERKRLGLVVSAETGYRTRRNPDSVRAPFVAYLSKETLARAEESSETFVPCGPDLAVEVLSPDDRWADMEEKVREYLDAGSKVVWIVNPRTETVHAYEAKKVRVLGGGDTIDGGAALSGFKAKVAAFFAKS